MIGFVCSICGEYHEGHTADWGYTLPDELWAIPEDERSKQAQFNTDLCKWGERRFIRCVLGVPFTETDGEFGWGVWAEVDNQTFERYLELYDADGSAEPRMAGRLANELPPYAGSIGMAVAIQFRELDERPALFLLPDDDSLLASEQRQGINSARLHNILEML